MRHLQGGLLVELSVLLEGLAGSNVKKLERLAYIGGSD